MKKIRILNLGAGVQSTTLALMAETGEIPKYDYAIFADVQAEPKAVYDHLDWLIKQLSYPVLVRTRGSLLENVKLGVNADGKAYMSIPAYTGEEGKLVGVTRRQCTNEYKVKVVERTIRREIIGLKPYQKFPKDVIVIQSMGLSYDEPRRVARVTASHKSQKGDSGWKLDFPLFDLEMTRHDCVKWLEDYGIPHTTPRSACTFCPYHSDTEWQRMKSEDPESWKQAVEVDRLIRDKAMRCNQGMRDQMWLHRSCKPLDQVKFNVKHLPGQSLFSFASECEGMCGN